VNLLDHRCFLAQLLGGVHLDDDPAVGAFFHQVGKLLVAHGGRIIRRMGLTQLHNDRFGLCFSATTAGK